MSDKNVLESAYDKNVLESAYAKNVLESAYDKTREMACKAPQMTEEAASNVHDFVTGDERNKTEKMWDEARAREARDYMAEKTHEAANQIQG